MGLWDRLLGRGNPSSYEPAQIVQPDPYEPFVSTGGIPIADPGAPVEWYILDKDRRAVEKFWREQPNLRKVVDYIARSIASTPLHLFDRAGDTDRVRVRDGALAGLLRTPAPRQGSYRFWHAVMSDSLLYDRWAVYVDRLFDGSVQLVHVPSWRLSLTTDPLRRVTGARYWVGDSLGRDQQWVDVPLDSLVFDYGYAPRGAGLSPVETLRDVLDENVEAVKYRRDVWRNGVRTPAQVTRPVDAPEWDPTKRDRFVAALRATYGRDGAQAGGMPLMEDGMKVEPLDVFKPSDVHDIEGRRLSAVEVSAAYHIAPELVGAQQGTFSNIDAFRQMLYGPSLGPYILAWEDALNAQLVPMLAPGTTQYIEANVESKLRGSFLEQAQILQSATGAPWMLRNEARAKLNLPALPDGDELVVPLNVLVGGQASPRDGVTAGGGGGDAGEVKSPFTPDDLAKLISAAAALIRSGFEPEASLAAVGLDPVEHLGLLPVTVQRPQVPDHVDTEIEDALKAAESIRRKSPGDPTVPEVAKGAEVLRGFFKRQGGVVLSGLGAGVESWWDESRWNRELSADLKAYALMVATSSATRALEAKGLSLDLDDGGILRALAPVIEESTWSVNGDVRRQLGGGSDSPVFQSAQAKAPALACELAARFGALGVAEAQRQSGVPLTD